MSGGDGGYHPSLAELERFMRGELPARETRLVLGHLLHGCDRCRDVMAPFASVMFVPGQLDEEAAVKVGSEYDFPISRALAAARRYEAALTQRKERDEGEQVLLLREVPAATIMEGKPSKEWVLCETLLERCRALRHRDPEGMLALAALASNMAERIGPEHDNPRALADLQARAWAELGNARRVANDPNGAEADFSRALARSARGTGDPLLLARFMDLTASLYTAQRRFEKALQLLDAAFHISQREGDTHSAGRALIKKGIAVGHALDPDEAVRWIAQGLELIDARREPKIVLAAVHNLITFLVDCGRLQEASRLLSDSRELYLAHAERLDELKARWVEGRIAAGFGSEEEAEQAFLEVRAGFEEAELSYDAALVSIDLAAIWLHRGRTAEIRSLIDEMLAVFRARNIRREAIGALLMLREAFERDRATVTLLRNVASELQRLDREPTRRARPEP